MYQYSVHFVQRNDKFIYPILQPSLPFYTIPYKPRQSIASKIMDSAAFLSSPSVKLLKTIIVTSLFSTYVAYIYNAWLKYDKGQVGMSTTMQHSSKTSLPNLSMCSLVPHNMSQLMEAEDKKLIFNVLNTEKFFNTM